MPHFACFESVEISLYYSQWIEYISERQFFLHLFNFIMYALEKIQVNDGIPTSNNVFLKSIPNVLAMWPTGGINCGNVWSFQLHKHFLIVSLVYDLALIN